jgi:hypothetical protein
VDPKIAAFQIPQESEVIRCTGLNATALARDRPNRNEILIKMSDGASVRSVWVNNAKSYQPTNLFAATDGDSEILTFV